MTSLGLSGPNEGNAIRRNVSDNTRQVCHCCGRHRRHQGNVRPELGLFKYWKVGVDLSERPINGEFCSLKCMKQSQSKKL